MFPVFVVRATHRQKKPNGETREGITTQRNVARDSWRCLGFTVGRLLAMCRLLCGRISSVLDGAKRKPDGRGKCKLVSCSVGKPFIWWWLCFLLLLFLRGTVPYFGVPTCARPRILKSTIHKGVHQPWYPKLPKYLFGMPGL